MQGSDDGWMEGGTSLEVIHIMLLYVMISILYKTGIIIYIYCWQG